MYFRGYFGMYIYYEIVRLEQFPHMNDNISLFIGSENRHSCH